MMQIKVLEGSYKIRGKDVDLHGMVFPLVEKFKVCLLYTSDAADE